MATETVNITNLGELGYVPDVEPNILPPNAFSYARNWRFDEAGHAEVTPGYSNAFTYRTKTEYGGNEADFSYLYTWTLNNRNTLAAYESTERQMKFIEIPEISHNLVETPLSLTDVSSLKATYKNVDTDALTSGQFRYDSETVSIRFADTDAAKTFAANVDTDARLYITGGSTETGAVNLIIPPSGAATRDSDLVTVSFTSRLLSLDPDAEFYVGIGTTFQHVDGAEHIWYGTDVNSIPLFVNELEAPWQVVDEYLPYLKTLDNWPTGGRCKQIVKFDAYLIAIGYTDTETTDVRKRGGSRSLAISDFIGQDEIGTFPDWDFNTENSDAQIYPLDLQTEGDLLGAVEANNILYIFTTTDTIAMTYDGDGAFSATRLPIGGGSLTSKSVCSIPNGRFHIGNNRMFIEDGNSYQPIGEGQWARTWFGSVDEERREEVQAIYDTRSHSVWIKTPTSEASQEIWILNLDTNTMSVLDDHQEVKYMLWSSGGIPSETYTWNTFSETEEWDNIIFDSWNEFPSEGLGDYYNRLLSCGGRSFFVHDLGATFNGRAIDAVLQREDVPGQRNSYHSYTISRLIPWVTTPSAGDELDVRVGGSQAHDRDVSWTPYKTYISGTTSKLDFRKSAKWGAVGFRSMTSGTILSGYELDIVPQNRR